MNILHKGLAGKNTFVDEQTAQGASTNRDKNSLLRRKFGNIVKVDPENPSLVSVRYDDGSLARGTDVPLIAVNRASRIAEEWGVLRSGMRVCVEYTGEIDRDARCNILGDEQLGAVASERYYTVPKNDIATGMYLIFSPGGIGLT